MPAARDEHLFLYELCVQRPAAVVELIRAAHARTAPPGHPPAHILHEDFSGSGAVSRVWVATDPLAHAVATDLDPGAIAFGSARAAESDLDPARLVWRTKDVRAPHEPAAAAPDAIFVGNFSIGELHTRTDLLAYLRSVRDRLCCRGVFICDTYGGAAAFRTGLVHRTHPGREPSERILYTWEQRSVDAFTARVLNALHFRIEVEGEIIAQHFDAFVYHWRLWSVPELRDALHEAGFSRTEVIEDLSPPGAADPSFARVNPTEHHIVCIAATA
jgi:hypothetical protein